MTTMDEGAVAPTLDMLGAVATQPEAGRARFIAHLRDAHATRGTPNRERWIENTEAYIEFMAAARLIAQLPRADRPVFSEPSPGLSMAAVTAHLRRTTHDLYRHLGCPMPACVASWEVAS